ncbi:MAG: hypothetical protein Kow0037_23180 [Calditrichia bacterium]
MNRMGASHLDVFLTFSDLNLLLISNDWKIQELKPGYRRFMGWDATTIRNFDFHRHFLAANELSLSEFLGHFNHQDFVVKNYFWRNMNGDVAGPYETFFKLKKEFGQIKSVMAFVKTSSRATRVEINPAQKYNLFLAQLLPGLIHNINGPLGTLLGRVELLQIKRPELKELSEVLKMGFRLQDMLENLTHKLVNERFGQPVEINLNRLLREEMKFLNADLFFKHQVELQEKYTNNIPQFRMHYLALSGVISECYHFFRNFVFEDQEYAMEVGSFLEGSSTGFYLNLMGEFRIPENLALRFPINITGDAVKIAQSRIEGIDTAFLAYCLQINKGFMKISGRKDMMTFRLEFPIPKV